MQSHETFQRLQSIRRSKITAATLLLAALALALALHPRTAGAAFNSSTNSMGNPARLPSLSGAAAVERLRQQGEYQSLAKAVADTRAKAQPDALIGQQTKLTANDGSADDYFGTAVAVSRDTAIIGAPGDEVVAPVQGSVYIFVRSGGLWTQQARLNALDGAAGDNFGTSVAISGETVVIGAPFNGSNKGAAYVFVRSGAVWSQQQKLTAADGLALDYFGYTVSVSGETLAAGAHGDDANKGAAYVFARNGAVWSQQAKLTAADGLAQDFFGVSISLSGDTLVAGASADDIGASAERGSAYVFTRNGITWSQQAKLIAGDGAAGDFFGNSVALSGDTLVAAAAQDDFNKGSAYVFVRNGAAWSQQAKLTASDGVAGDRFGAAVAISGATVAVGASSDYVGSTQQQGSAYVFSRSGAAWIQQARLTANDGAQQDQFGIAIAVDGDAVVAGTFGTDVGANLLQGAAYAFAVSGALVQQQIIIAADGAAGDQFGVAVAVSGNTAVIGAPTDGIGANPQQGSVYVYVRNGASWSLQQKLTAGDGAANDIFGIAIALSGDTLVIGAAHDDTGATPNHGSVYVFVRNGAAWSQQQKLTAADAMTNDSFGSAIALSGNTLVAGASSDDSNKGSAYVFVRNGTLWSQQQKLVAADGAVQDSFGFSVGISGDTVVVGAYGDTIGANAGRGSAYVFVRNGATWSQQQKLTAGDGAAFDNFGLSVALDGDTLVSGAPLDNVGGNSGQGSAYVFVRNGATWSQQQKLTAADGTTSDFFGYSVALNGESIVVGAYLDDIISQDEGSAYLFVRSGATWEQRQQLKTPSGGSVDDHFGFAVAISGDTVVAGVFSDNLNGNADQGSAYIFAGGTCPAITVNPATLANGVVGNSYNQTVTAAGGTAPYDFTVSLGALPPGLTLSPSGFLSGTPVTAGTFNFTITATAATLCPGSRAYTLTITGNCPAITVNPATLPNGATGAAYNQIVTATGGAAPYTYTISAGSLPGGLNLASGGALTGAPNAAGVFNFTIKATDTNGCFGSRAYTVTVTGAVVNNSLQFYPLSRPVRILDTRAGQGNCDNISTPINGGSSLTTFARLSCEGIAIPPTAQAVVGNVTVINQTAQTGYMTIYPDGQAAPLAANMIYGPNGILANNFTVGLGANGNFNIFGEKTIDAIVDISGYYAPPGAGGLYYHPLSKPVRLLDTRPGQGNCDNVDAAIAAGTSLTTLAHSTCESLTIPATAQAIVGNATVINGSGQTGYLTIYPEGVPAPLAANIVYFPGQILANAFTVSLSANGEFNIFGEKTIDMVIDVAGYYSNEANDVNGAGLLFTSLATPVRLLDTRAGQGNCDSVNGPITGGGSLSKLARMTCEGQLIPNNAQSIIGNVTVINQTNQVGYLTLYPTGQVAPLAANMIYAPSQILSNAFVVGLSGAGQFNIFAERTLDAIVDVSGFFTP
jgi:hypothetical protein